MDMDDFTPASGGSLRDSLRPETREPVGTFTPTRTLHPDEIWNPRSREITGHRPWRPDVREDRTAGDVERFSHEEAAGQMRAALRPGV